MTFSNPHNHSRVSQRERIPPRAFTMEARGGNALKHLGGKKEEYYKNTNSGYFGYKHVANVAVSKQIGPLHLPET